MASRSFPFPLRIGTDICQISRIHKIIVSPNGRRFVDRVIAPDESQPQYIKEALKAVEANRIAGREAVIQKCATWMAGRWAAKEAVIKAHKRKLFMHDIMIAQNLPVPEQNHPPVALLRHSRKGEPGVDDRPHVVQISISHDGDYATATCLAYDPWTKDDWLQRFRRMGGSPKKPGKGGVPKSHTAKENSKRAKPSEKPNGSESPKKNEANKGKEENGWFGNFETGEPGNRGKFIPKDHRQD